MNARQPPRATYRLQFSHEFTFSQAERIVPYLAALGVSHVYASPCLKARAGSLHGYDIVDHTQLNPEIGSREQFGALVDALHQCGMGLILDWVPNHMGIAGNENPWWLDVLEHGQSSRYAAYFDIDWHPIRESLRGQVLLPVLGDHYGRVLENGELNLEFNAALGEFSVRYLEHRFPIDPETYPLILAHRVERLSSSTEEDGHVLIEWHSLITEFERLGGARCTPLERYRSAAACKRQLAELYARSPCVREFLRENIAALCGEVGQPETFDPLHALLERQSFQLAYWRVASDEINYRRFFDINELACLRQENPEVFDATHRLLLGLIADGSVDGLRIDHPDGLYDPRDYFRQLQREAGRIVKASDPEKQGQGRCIYVAVEKILAGYERLREDWLVAGTTGYDFANLVNGLFIYPAAERTLTRLYDHYTGQHQLFEEVLYDRKRRIILLEMSSELTTLVNLLSGIAQSNRRTRDYTVTGLRDALLEVVACFPVYRTYITANGVTEEDRRFVTWAVAQARKRCPLADATFLDFVQRMLLLEYAEDAAAEEQARILRFTMKFQQYTAPVMAKGMEDTAFYVYNRLVSLNEVGGDPRRFGVSIAAFHHANQQRLEHWPDSMLNTATHDSKRSGDVRARINVITELAEEWQHAVARWSRLNRNKKISVDDQPAPSRNDEYLLYQTLLGAWPLEADEQVPLLGRIEAYMAKATREAKIHTSWSHPNDEYERSIIEFVRALFDRNRSQRFLQDFSAFQQRIARFGCFNSLSQVLLLLTSPGVPDLYQGTELWRFNLVDPDNRRPVDFDSRSTMLADLCRAHRHPAAPESLLDLLRNPEDGRAKLFLIWKTLAARQAYRELFARGDYLPLETRGKNAEHLCAFIRRWQKTTVIVIAARWFARLPEGPHGCPVGSAVWEDTTIIVPTFCREAPIADALGGGAVEMADLPGGPSLSAAQVLNHFPVGLLISAS